MKTSKQKVKRKIMILDFKRKGIFNMESEKVKYLIDMINDMDIKDKLRLAICMSDSRYTNLKYDKPEMYSRFDNMLKELDDEYRIHYVKFAF